MKSIATVALLSLVYAGSANAAQTIFIGGAVNPAGQPLYTVDPSTGAATAFGTNVGLMEGMSFDTLRGRVVATQRNSNILKTIDPVSGIIGTLPVSVPTGLEGLAYDSNRDLFWACDQTSGNMYRINAVTGAATLVGPISSGSVHPGGLGFDPVSDRIYAVANDRLYRITPFSPAAIPIGPVGFGIGFTDVDAVEFDTATGLLYMVNDDAISGPNPLAQHFASLDPATGLGTLIGPTGLTEQFGQGMAIIAPEPTSSIALATYALVCRRRRTGSRT